MGWENGNEKVVQALEHFYFDQLTVFGNLDPGALVLPNDGGWRRADHVADDISIVTFVELLWARGVFECNFFCREL